MPRKIVVSEATDWELVCIINREGFLTDLPKFLVSKLAKHTWALQDGYGAPGFTPCQGWDWSGIRDSSPGAKLLMGQMVRAGLVARKITEFTVGELDLKGTKVTVTEYPANGGKPTTKVVIL